MKISVLATGIALLAACAPSTKHSEQEREKAYVSEVSVKGFEVLSDYYAKSAQRFYFGPSNIDPSVDVSGPDLRVSVPPSVDLSNLTYVTIADGFGRSDDGVKCYVVADKSKPGAEPASEWRLNGKQEEQRQSGTRVVLRIAVSCYPQE